jgi:hypothetical protein
MLSLLTLVLLGATPDCSALGGWQAGRGGASAAVECDSGDYREAHRLGSAWHALAAERRAVLAQLAAAPDPGRAALRRRQRQLDTDLEAIRGLATIRGWPLDPLPEPAP